MKQYVYAFFCLILFVSTTAAQTLGERDNSPQAEEFRTQIAAAEGYYQAGEYTLAAASAIKAHQTAEKLQNAENIALALFWQGRTLHKLGGRKRAAAAQVLEKAYRIAQSKGNTTLIGLILEQQRQIALDRGKERDAARFQKLLQANTLNAQVASSTNVELPESESPRLQERLRALDAELSVRQMERAVLAKERLALTKTIAEQEQAIESMNESQAKALLTLEYQRRLVDSLRFDNEMDSLKLDNQGMLLRQKESEVQLKNTERNLSYVIAAFILAISLGLLIRIFQVRAQGRVLEEKNKIIQEERKRSEALLLNILPANIAEELKQEGRAAARHIEQATVLFCDFQNFTAISEVLSPQELVHHLDACFRGFDQIIETYQLEKIKTIGDCYMVVGGLAATDPEHPTRIIHAAFDMLHFLDHYNEGCKERSMPAFEARVGIHSGSLIAGVVGEKKFAYDVWGDTVNIASRMESAGEVGRVNISAYTHQLIEKEFRCSYRGKITVKHKGEIDMYFVEDPNGGSAPSALTAGIMVGEGL